MAANPNVDPFQASGGGVFVGGGWVPKNNQAAQDAYSGLPAQQTPGAPVKAQMPIQGPNAPATQTAGQAVTQNATVGAQPAQGSQTNVAGAFQQALVNKLAPQAVSADSPHLKPAIDANRLAQQRAAERQRATLAERAHADGYDSSGAFDSLALGIDADRGMREGAFEGGLLRDAQSEQDRMVMAALGLGGNMLGQQDQLAQQRYGIDTDAQLRREGLGVQSDLGGRDINLRGELGRGQLNLGLLNALMSDDQFRTGLSANLGMFNANKDANFWGQFL